MIGPVELIKRLGKGANPASLGLSLTSDGYLDLRNLKFPRPEVLAKIETPVGAVNYTRSKPILKRVRLKKADLTGSSIAHSVWEKATLVDVKMDSANMQGTSFEMGHLEAVSFRGVDLAGSVWGFRGRAGPTVVNCDFTDADLRHSHHSHPLYRNCRFIQTKLDEVDFRGSRFENCVFEGRLPDVWFRERFPDSNPFVAVLRNRMKNVDFSRAELVFVSFLGVDLTSCKLPAEGHMVIPRPRLVFRRALELVEREWQGSAREKAASYLNKMLQYQLKQDVPLNVIRPRDLVESPLGREVAERILHVLDRSIKDLGL